MHGDAEAITFARALARKRARFAFPDAFNAALAPLQERLAKRAGKNSDEGRHVDALIELRAAAAPAWNAGAVTVTLWLIKGHDPEPQQWPRWLAEWAKLIDQSGRYKLDGALNVVRLEDMRASEYVASQHLDLDQLSS